MFGYGLCYLSRHLFLKSGVRYNDPGYILIQAHVSLDILLRFSVARCQFCSDLERFVFKIVDWQE